VKFKKYPPGPEKKVNPIMVGVMVMVRVRVRVRVRDRARL